MKNPYTENFAKVFAASVLICSIILAGIFLLFLSTEAKAANKALTLQSLDMICMKNKDFIQKVQTEKPTIIERSKVLILDPESEEPVVVFKVLLEDSKGGRILVLSNQTDSCEVFYEPQQVNKVKR